MFRLKKIEHLEMEKLRLATRLEKVEPRNETLSVTELDCLFSTFSLSTCYKPDLILDVGDTRMYVKETLPVFLELTALLGRQTSKHIIVSCD